MDNYFFEAAARNGGRKEWTINKTGHNLAVPTTLTPVTHGGIYRTPQVSGSTTLRIKAGGNANDTENGTGAREVTLYGLDTSGNMIEESLATNGASASSATTQTFLRLYGILVTKSGTYASVSSFSHAGTITIENSSGGTDWGIIESSSSFDSQSEIGAFTVPKGYAAYIKRFGCVVDSTKSTEIYVYQRPNILQTAAPYSPLRKFWGLAGVNIETTRTFDLPLTVPELSDIIVLAKVSSTTAIVEVTMDILLRNIE